MTQINTRVTKNKLWCPFVGINAVDQHGYNEMTETDKRRKDLENENLIKAKKKMDED